MTHHRGDYPAIPDPQATVVSHQETLIALKVVTDTLTGQRRAEMLDHSAVTWSDLVELGLITKEQIPKR